MTRQKKSVVPVVPVIPVFDNLSDKRTFYQDLKDLDYIPSIDFDIDSYYSDSDSESKSETENENDIDIDSYYTKDISLETNESESENDIDSYYTKDISLESNETDKRPIITDNIKYPNNRFITIGYINSLSFNCLIDIKVVKHTGNAISDFFTFSYNHLGGITGMTGNEFFTWTVVSEDLTEFYNVNSNGFIEEINKYWYELSENTFISYKGFFVTL